MFVCLPLITFVSMQTMDPVQQRKTIMEFQKQNAQMDMAVSSAASLKSLCSFSLEARVVLHSMRLSDHVRLDCANPRVSGMHSSSL
jgi:hypothetical protein